MPDLLPGSIPPLPTLTLMEEGRTNTAGDEEVEARDEGLTTGAAIDKEAGDLVWDPQGPLFRFNDKNLGVTQTPVAA